MEERAPPVDSLTSIKNQNSRLFITLTDTSSITPATEQQASAPSHGKPPERRYVCRSRQKSPVTSRHRFRGRSHASNTIVVRNTSPKATAGAVYSPSAKHETNIATAEYTKQPD